MTELHITYRPADDISSRKFLNWQYEPPYDFYNCTPEQVEGAVRYNSDPKNNVYAMYDRSGELVAYCSYGADAQVAGGDYNEEALDIGMMLKPELTGQGLGIDFAREVIRNGVEKYSLVILRVTIAAFNRRAMRVWEKNGFQKAQTFNRLGDGVEFVVMTRNTGG